MFFLNKIFLSVVAGVVVIGAIVGITVKNNDKKGVAQSNPAPVESSKTVESSSQKTAQLSGLLNSKDPVSCTYATSTPEGSSSGTIYISGGKLYGEIMARSAKQPTADGRMNMIYDGASLYLWSSLSPNGIKIAATSEGWGGLEAATPIESVWERKNTYDCKSWSTDVSKFIPPSSIQFLDFAQQLQRSIQQGMKNVKP